MEILTAIGKRTSLSVKDHVFSLVIIPTDQKKKTGLLFLWLFAWTISGIIVISSYPQVHDQNAKIMLVIWMAFWAYFEFKIIRVFMWKRFGKEKLWVKNGKLHYQQDINGRGKVKEFDANLITDLIVINVEKANFADSFNQSFWVKGGERLEFLCQGKKLKFGMQLEDEDATKILAELKKFLKKGA
jgi:hypothetical protein